MAKEPPKNPDMSNKGESTWKKGVSPTQRHAEEMKRTIEENRQRIDKIAQEIREDFAKSAAQDKINEANNELYNAAVKGNTIGVQAAIQKGASVDFINPETQKSVLQAAVDAGKTETSKLLVARGAKGIGTDIDINMNLYKAALDNNVNGIETAIALGADVNYKHSNLGEATALHAAFLNHSAEAATLLLDKGAKLDAKINNKMAPADYLNISRYEKIDPIKQKNFAEKVFAKLQTLATSTPGLKEALGVLAPNKWQAAEKKQSSRQQDSLLSSYRNSAAKQGSLKDIAENNPKEQAKTKRQLGQHENKTPQKEESQQWKPANPKKS